LESLVTGKSSEKGEAAFWRDKRVFITGASGLVGSWLTRRLVDYGAYVVVLMRDWDPQTEIIRSGLINRTSVINGKLEDFNSLERAIVQHEIDTVFHLGAQTIVGTAYRSPLDTFDSNVRGTYNLLEACRLHPSLVKRVLIASSDKAYGDGESLPYTEKMPPMGKHPYDVSKSCTDLISTTYHETYNVPIVIARCGNIYGGGDLNWSRIIPGTIKSLYCNQNPIIRSNGKYTRDYVFVEDAVSSYLLMAEKLESAKIAGEAFNFGPESPRNVLEIVSMISKLMRKEHLAPKILDQAKAEIKDQYLSSEKAARVLGWKPHYTLEKGLEQTLKWYLDYFEVKQ